MIFVLAIGLLLLLIISVPIYIALAGSAFAGISFGGEIDPKIVVARMFAGLDYFVLMAVPFFILAANVMRHGGMSRRIVNLARVLVGGYNGGMAFTTILACMFFGAICGSAPATVAGVGGIVYPSLIDAKYDKRFSAGLVASSSSVALLIPPSISMIIYAAVTGVSVGALFITGFGAGVVFGLIFFVYSYFYVRRHRVILAKKSSLKEIVVAVKNTLWEVGVAVIIIGGIYGGVFTPTEAAAVSAVYAILVCCFIRRELNLKGLYQAGLDAAKTTAMVLIMIAGASAFGWVLIVTGVPHLLANAVLGATQNPALVILQMVIAMLIAGMFIDPGAFIIILVPLFLPIATAVRIDPLHLGIVTVAAAAIGMYTPPFGLNLFVAVGVTRSTFDDIVSGIWPFVAISIVIIFIITYVPEISMWLPHRLYG